MKLTAALRKYAIEVLGCKEGDGDAALKAAIFDALGSGKLTQEKFAEMLNEKAQGTAADMIAKAVADAMNPVISALKGLNVGGAASGAGGATAPAAPAAPAEPTLTEEETRIKAMLDRLGFKTPTAAAGGAGGDDASDPTRVVFKSANGVKSPRVKGVAEKYTAGRSDVFYPAQKKGGMKHPFAGQQAMYAGEKLQTSSRLGKAVASAYFKWCLATSCAAHDIPRGLKMTDEDRDLVNYALHEMEWSGVVKTRDDGYDWESKVARRKLTELEIKAMLDDGTSGGIEIAPIEFDDALVTTPVLYGELFPLVNVVDVSRGRRMKGGAIGNPTFAASTEGTAITPFDTTAFVSAFDTNIYVAAAAMEIGMDFEEDSPTNVGAIIMEKYGEKAQEWLDEQIAVGDGTTEPEGVFTASGTTSVASDMGTGGPATVGDYEGLMFGVPKAYRASKGSRNVYIGNETSYRRARAIPVGPADERRVFGMTHADFMLLDTPYKIQASIPNSSIAYANLGYYRMYRRLGFNIRMENTGNYLAIRNLRLVVCRMRYGGRLELGAACAVQQDAQS